MNQFFTLLLICAAFFSTAQTTTDFESFTIPEESALFGEDGNGGYEEGNTFLPNLFNPDYSSWSGWSISNSTDTTTPGFGNQFGAITGAGYGGSTNYGINFVFGESQVKLTNEAAGGAVEGMYITNGTWAYLSMLEGDDFAKKFGGLTGDDPDYFLLTIKKYENGELSTDSIDFYLADYRFEDNEQDYIINEWRYIDLSSLGNMDSLSFTLSSTDNHPMFGMNTPAFFCMDNFTTKDQIVSINDYELDAISIYPNPSTDYIKISSESKAPAHVRIFDLNGILITENKKLHNNELLNIQYLNAGIYYIEVAFDSKTVTKTWIKN